MMHGLSGRWKTLGALFRCELCCIFTNPLDTVATVHLDSGASPVLTNGLSTVLLH